ncbi:MAG: hypothetical protein GF416_01925 [Candidatus Altiarchaeales archaeon]|nr:hypothetical protein [Candidatus Altiarchaeales archaeon]MBD3415875.1 hypothetical protein [Candidatus Altiarchaeales archaeon]
MPGAVGKPKIRGYYIGDDGLPQPVSFTVEGKTAHIQGREDEAPPLGAAKTHTPEILELQENSPVKTGLTVSDLSNPGVIKGLGHTLIAVGGEGKLFTYDLEGEAVLGELRARFSEFMKTVKAEFPQGVTGTLSPGIDAVTRPVWEQLPKLHNETIQAFTTRVLKPHPDRTDPHFGSSAGLFLSGLLERSSDKDLTLDLTAFTGLNHLCFASHGKNIKVNGSVGDCFAMAARSGEITLVNGDAEDRLGEELNGAKVIVDNARDNVGHNMTTGQIIVRNRARDRLGSLMGAYMPEKVEEPAIKVGGCDFRTCERAVRGVVAIRDDVGSIDPEALKRDSLKIFLGDRWVVEEYWQQRGRFKD